MARIPRIYHPTPLQGQSQVHLTEQAAQHVGRVLRLGKGAPLVLFDGLGGQYRAEISHSDRRHVVVQLLAFEAIGCESPLAITLAQGVSKGERMDFTLQKAVELGVQRIAPLATERSVVHVRGERRDKKLAHWQGVIISACEQCGRNTLPMLLPWQGLPEWLARPRDDNAVGLLLDPRAEHSLTDLPEQATALTLLIGPEGGLSAAERCAAYQAGYQGLRLGPRVLRTETAALTAIAALQARWGDLA
jgi:16S rRNA (uracil1498-N3)-methyltransferase